MALTWAEWDRRRARLKRSFPVRWFFSETLPDFHSHFIKYPMRKTKNWFRYRFKERYHVVKTGLAPNYYDADTRMIHAAFQLLVDYVEIELATSHYVGEELEKEDKAVSGRQYYKIFKRLRRKQKRDPKAGLAHLDWEINESPGSSFPIAGNQTQAQAAMEKKFLYLWWTKYRPARIDVHHHPLIWNHNGYDPSKDVFSQDCSYQHHLMHELEKFYNAEDTEMFRRLVEIRDRMWI